MEGRSSNINVNMNMFSDRNVPNLNGLNIYDQLRFIFKDTDLYDKIQVTKRTGKIEKLNNLLNTDFQKIFTKTRSTAFN